MQRREITLHQGQACSYLTGTRVPGDPSSDGCSRCGWGGNRMLRAPWRLLARGNASLPLPRAYVQHQHRRVRQQPLPQRGHLQGRHQRLHLPLPRGFPRPQVPVRSERVQQQPLHPRAMPRRAERVGWGHGGCWDQQRWVRPDPQLYTLNSSPKLPVRLRPGLERDKLRHQQ